MQQTRIPRMRRSCRAALMAAAAVLSLAASALAGAPAMKKTQVPGYYRMALGDFEITALYDGSVKLDAKLLKGAKPGELAKLFESMFVDASTGVQTAVNAYLVNTGRNLILVDTGSGKALGPSMGLLPDNIRAAGYEPGQVDTVLLTHLHPDHVLGLIDAEGKAVFPNASVMVSRQEASFWLDEQEEAKAPEGRKRLFKAARNSLAPYIAAGKFSAFEQNGQLPEGARAVFTTGHTPGHCGYMFTSGGKRFLAMGDIVHSHAVQFARPDVSIEFDSDQKQAVATRLKVFSDAAGGRYFVAGAHIPFPGIGHVRRLGKGYDFVPVEYGPVEAVKAIEGK